MPDINKILEDDVKKSILDALNTTGLIKIDNLGDIKFPDNLSVNNLADLNPHLEDIRDAVNAIEVKPVVNVQQPDVHVSQPEVDITPVVHTLERLLKKLHTNSATKPLAVRLSDGKKFISQLTHAIKEANKDILISSPGSVAIKGNVKADIQSDNTLIDEDTTVTSGKVIMGQDQTGKAQIISTNQEGVANVALPDSQQLFTDILKELKKLNIQMAIMTDCQITNKDVEV